LKLLILMTKNNFLLSYDREIFGRWY